MFGLFKSDPVKKLQKQYEALLEKGVHYQRNGKMDLFAKVSQEADNILKEINKLKAEKSQDN